jgi:hypothetical protein
MSNTNHKAVSEALHGMLKSVADEVSAKFPGVKVTRSQAGVMVSAYPSAKAEMVDAWREVKRVAAERYPARKWYAMRHTGRNTWWLRDDSGRSAGMLRMGVAVERTDDETTAICLGIWPGM